MKKRHVSQKEFNGIVAGLCRDIANSGWRPDYVVGITRGGLAPAVMISEYFDIKMHTLNVSFRHGANDLETNCWMSEDAYGYVPYDIKEPIDPDRVTSDPALRKNILIVDDINDSGKTINWIIDDWKASCLPDDPAWNDIWGHNVRIAVVFDRLTSKSNVKMDYVGEDLADDTWIVFPAEEWWK